MQKEHKRGFAVAAMLVALAIALMLSGCATSRPYTKGEKWALAGAVVGQAWDVGSTAYAVSNYDNLSESNPMWDDLDDQELMGAMLLTKAALLGGGYLLGEWKPDWRIKIYSVIGGAWRRVSAGRMEARLAHQDLLSNRRCWCGCRRFQYIPNHPARLTQRRHSDH